MSEEQKLFWDNFLSAIKTEPRPSRSIVGASGITHAVLAIGADDANKRLVVISGDHDARASAMMQTDIEATLPGVHVVVARPIAVGLPVIAQAIIEFFGSDKLTAEHLKMFGGKGRRQKQMLQSFQEVLMPKLLMPAAKAFEMVPLDILSQVLYIIKQLTYLDISMAPTAVGNAFQHVNLDSLAHQDLMQSDREVGICPLPLYSFSETDWEIFRSHSTSDIAEHLKILQVYQYFFPAPDQAILGLADRTELSKDDVGRDLQRLVEMGHPIGDPELVARTPTVISMVEALQDRGLIVEGKVHFTLTENGNKIRGDVKFKPREGVISKLINRLRVNLNVRNYFG
jgi:hypothetical protein